MEPSPEHAEHQPLRRWRDSWPRLVWKVVFAAGTLYTLTLIVAGWRVAARDNDPATPPLDELNWSATEPGRIDLPGQGARVRVSSFHAHGRHHPLYLQDGRRRPATTIAKWVSAPEDRAPWAEVTLPAPHHVKRIELAHAGIREHPNYTMRRYTLSCLNTKGQVIERVAVQDNRAAVVRHQIDCPDTVTVRIDFEVAPVDTARGVVRLYEVALFDAGSTRPPRRQP